ncbi:hypothetical protein TNCV_2556721 [Trichonephila clavipes]|nr:hypothetical protein TNCV_2556721 [Trichonephila clavipes]
MWTPQQKVQGVLWLTEFKSVTRVQRRFQTEWNIATDFFLFPRFKSTLKEKRFTDITDIQSNVTDEQKAIPKELSYRSFQALYTRSQQCITIHGDYFEGQSKLYSMLYSTVFEIKIHSPNFLATDCIYRFDALTLPWWGILESGVPAQVSLSQLDRDSKFRGASSTTLALF